VDSKRVLTFTDGGVIAVPEPVNYITVPDDGYEYIRVLHDWEHREWDGKPRTKTATPEIVSLYKHEFIDLTEPWQRRWFAAIEWASNGTMTSGQLKTAWSDVTAERKALTDMHGLRHKRTDYILGLFLSSTKKIAQRTATFGGSLLRLRSAYGSEYQVDALNVLQPPPPLEELVEQPYYMNWLTEIVNVKLPDKTYKASRWPQLKHWGRWGVPYFIISRDGKKSILKKRATIVEPGSTFAVYNPPTA